MNVNAAFLRARRMELGITTRELARAANISQGVVKRLEETGDASVLTVGTLALIVDALSVTVGEAFDHGRTAGAPNEHVSAIGALLIERRKRLTPTAIAATLGIPLGDIEGALTQLDIALRNAGLCVNRNTNGVRIFPVARATLGTTTLDEQLRHLSHLNRSDLSLLYEVTRRIVHVNVISARANGAVALHKLAGAGLVTISNGTIQLSATTRVALGLDAAEQPTTRSP